VYSWAYLWAYLWAYSPRYKHGNMKVYTPGRSSAYLQPTSAYLSLPQPTSAYSRKVLSLSSAYLQPTPGRSSAYLSLPQSVGCPRGEEGLLRRQYIWYVGVSYSWVYSVRMTEVYLYGYGPPTCARLCGCICRCICVSGILYN